MKENLPLNGYVGLCALYLLSVTLEIEGIAWTLKPLLLPCLVYAVYKAEYFATKRKLMFALIFSWIGDVVLMFSGLSELYFIVGLVLFLISHIYYVDLFYKQRRYHKAYKNILFWLCCALVLYYLKTMLELLLPTLGELKIPVGVYAVTISAMLVMAFRVYFSAKDPGKYLVLLGAVSFVVSDSLLAVNKFHFELQYASLLIMSTYLLAQFGITLGVLRMNKKK